MSPQQEAVFEAQVEKGIIKVATSPGPCLSPAAQHHPLSLSCILTHTGSLTKGHEWAEDTAHRVGTLLNGEAPLQL